ncbi:hypothetical protein [Peribacillus butanolivorans]|uniref:hypothetical protein n=1 Tax=Peribacillus butanolivorans TaxID=421767 RepID=UPI0036704B9B
MDKICIKDRLLIGLKNPTNRTKTVRVTVERAEDFLFPATSLESTILNQLVSLPSENWTVLRIFAGPTTFQGDNMLRALKVRLIFIYLDKVFMFK